MKIHFMSDLHLEHDLLHPYLPVMNGEVDADVVVLAGDVDAARSISLPFEIRRKTGIPVVFVCGNHEHYSSTNGTVQQHHRILRNCAKGDDGVHFLENESIVIDGVRFIGATLWTDFELHGANVVKDAMKTAHRHMNDHLHVFTERDSEETPGEKYVDFLTPEDTRSWHARSRDYIESSLAEHFDGPTVVVTHHAPHWDCLKDPFTLDRGGRLLNPAYGSDLSKLMEADTAPDFWISGHTHLSKDFVCGNTRVLSNARGYLHKTTLAPENDRFDDRLVVDTDDRPRSQREDRSASN